MATTSSNWQDRGSERIDAASLGLFRIAIAACVLWDVVRLWATGGVSERYVDPYLYFKYPAGLFIRDLTGLMPYTFFGTLPLLALAVLLGWRTRWTSVLLAAATAYWFLIDAADYSDHFWLLVLATVLLACLPVNRWWSIDRLQGRETLSTVPRAALWAVQGQALVVALCSAYSLFAADWLAGAPLTEWAGLDPRWNWLAAQPELARSLAWGYLLFEAGALAVLLWRPLRGVWIWVFLAWQGLDAWWWRIGPSPAVMACLALTFLSPDWPRAWGDRISGLFARIPGTQVVIAGLGFVGHLIDRAVGWFDDTPVFGQSKSSPNPGAAAAAKPAEGREAAWLVKFAAAWVLAQVVFAIYSWGSGRNAELLASRFVWRGQRLVRQSDLSFSIIVPSQQLRWPLDPTSDFPIPLAMLIPQEELERRGLSEGALRDLVQGAEEDVTLQLRIEGMGFTQAEATRILDIHEQLNRLRLPPHQATALEQHPELVWQYARRVGHVLERALGEKVTVHVDWETSLNFRPFVALLDNGLDVSSFGSLKSLGRNFSRDQPPLPPLADRRLAAREWQVEQARLAAASLPTTGAGRPKEVVKVPPFDDADEAWLSEHFP